MSHAQTLPTNPQATDSTNVALSDLADDALALAEQWRAEAASDVTGGGGRKRGKSKARADADRLGKLVSDPAGLAVAVSFIDDVARPQDNKVAAKALAKLGTRASGAQFLSAVDRGLLRLGGEVATLLPDVVVPAARMRLKQLVGHLVADAGPGLTAHLARTRAEGYGLNVNLLGEAVLGESEADARLHRTIELVQRPDVDYISIKVSSVAPQLVTWDLPGSTQRVVQRLLPLFEAARDNKVFINLDMEEYRDLALTTAVFRDILDRPEFLNYEAGIVLQAYLPDAIAALDELTDWAVQRVEAGGAPIKIRLVKGANLAMETVEAKLHYWETAPFDNKPDVDANYLRFLDRALTPERTKAVRLGVASHNLNHVALAALLARERGVGDALDIEMLQGMAPGEAAAVKATIEAEGGKVVLYTPAVRNEDFDVAISYLVRRMEENAAEQNYLHAQFAGNPDAMLGQADAFRAAVTAATESSAPPVRRRAARVGTELAVAGDQAGAGEFRNAIDTDPALPEHRDWAARLVSENSPYQPVKAPEVTDAARIDGIVDRAIAAQQVWAQVPAEARATALDAIGARLSSARAELVATAVHEARKTVAEADPEVSEAVDFAHYYAQSARQLGDVPGAKFSPAGVTLVTPPWNFPIAIPAGGVLAALAAGSSVIAKPASPTPRCFEAVIEQTHAGLDDASAVTGLTPEQNRDLVQFIRVSERALGKHLVSHPGIDRVILTGSTETAELFASWRPDRPVFAETSGKNSIIVTPSADLDLAVADVVKSALGHAGQKCSAASLVILTGSVADPKSPAGSRFRRQLVDAIESLAVGLPTDLGTTMGPLTVPADGKLHRALTTLEPGESWLVQPRELADEAASAELGAGRLWTPGLKEGVTPDSWFHLTEVFGPVLGIMSAPNLREAIKRQNATSFGLTAGIHSLDDDEIAAWKKGVEAGNLYVNRPITGAIVQRQPFGGWKGSSVGPGAKAGGPQYVGQFGEWADATEAGVPDRLADPAGWLEWAKADDVRAWAKLSTPVDPTALGVESNEYLMRPLPEATIWVGADATRPEVERVLHAAATTGTHVTVHSDIALPPEVLLDIPVSDRLAAADPVTAAELAQQVADGEVAGRIRVIGTAPGLADAAANHVATTTVLAAPVLAAGERELLNFAREQAISQTKHRYGHQKP